MFDIPMNLKSLEKEILAYESEPVETGKILFYGHSLFTRWGNAKWGYRRMDEDLRSKDGSLAVVNHGFGTSTSEELLYYYPRMVRPWAPRALVLASFSKSGSLYDMRGFFPAEYSAQTFVELFTDDVNGLYPYKKWFMNTLYVASMSCIFGTILVILTGYVMSKFNFKGRNGVKKLTLVLGMFPGFMGMTAIYIIMAQLNLLNRLEALIFLYSATAPMG